jgi:hypothetical protein
VSDIATNAEIIRLAGNLGITDSQLAKLRAEYLERYEDDKAKAERKLREWLSERWAEMRDRRRLLSRRSVPAYTESPSEAMTDAGEAPDPNEIASYRKSQEARDTYQTEQMDELGELMAAMRAVRDSLDALSQEKKQKMGRAIWSFKGRMDALERDIRRRIAA